MDELLYETQYLTIAYNAEIPTLIVKWTGFTSSQQFRDGIDKIFAYMAEKNITSTITDISEHKVIATEDQEYAAKRSVEYTQQYGVVKRALITPQDAFARFSIKQVNAQVSKQDNQDRRFFGSIEDAKEWLLEGDK